MEQEKFFFIPFKAMLFKPHFPCLSSTERGPKSKNQPVLIAFLKCNIS